MIEINTSLIFLSGLTSMFSPYGLFFLGIIVTLTISAIKTKKQILLLISFIVIGIVFVISYNTGIVFPIGSILGTIISNEDNMMKIVFLLGGISIPLGITIVGVWKIKGIITN